MSQIVICQDAKGIVLATDGRAVDFDPGGRMIYQGIKKAMEGVAENQDEIGPPFHYAYITADGFRRVE